MKTVDTQQIVTKTLFKHLVLSLQRTNEKSIKTLDEVAKDVIANYSKNEELKTLTVAEKDKLCLYMQFAFCEF
jgi:hypothetical protein